MSTVTLPEPAARQAKEFVKRICVENEAFYRDPRGMGALKELQQTFPHPWLYVAELLQNAVDARAKRISVTFVDDNSFVFEHDGNAFTAENTKALCTKGVSTKGANTVGFMGIGFKSVFQSYQKAQISSGDFRFALNVGVTRGEEYGDLQRNWVGCVLPEWDEQALPPSAGMTCRFVLSNRLPRLEPLSQDLEHAIGESETLLALLAWQGVTELSWNGKLWLLECRETPLQQNGDVRVRLTSLDEATNAGRKWVLFCREYQPSRQAIARFLEHRQLTPSADKREEVYAAASKSRRVALFCELAEDGSPIPPARGSAYALLPTGVTFPLGLHVQADWLLVVSRRELMQVEGNEWHEEILDQLPKLIRYFIEWVVDRKENSGFDWERGYHALPDLPTPDLDSDAWFGTERFLASLRLELEPLSFLPRLSGPEATSGFLSPNEGRVLPKPFVKDFEDPTEFPHLLFGDRIISSGLLGRRAVQCLEQLDLLRELKPTELVEHWRTGAVKKWLDASYGEQLQPKMLCNVLKALASLDDKVEWKIAPLVCLPTEGGTWTHRQEIARYPADWNILAQEDDIRESLERFLDSKERLLSWELEVVLRQSRNDAQPYLQSVSVPKLEGLVNQWWESLPESPSTEQNARVARFTAWVLEKQPQRKALVQRVLSIYGDGSVHLVEPKNALLADPYAGSYRRLFFPKKPTVASHYESCGATADRADWRSFFETLSPAPAGRFTLFFRSNVVSYYELQQFVGGGYTPPATRSTWLSLNWKGLSVRNDSYSVIDVVLPDSLTTVLNAKVTKELCSAIVNWLSEFPTQFSEFATVTVAYIPYGAGHVNTFRLSKPSRWLTDISDAQDRSKNNFRLLALKDMLMLGLFQGGCEVDYGYVFAGRRAAYG